MPEENPYSIAKLKDAENAYLAFHLDGTDRGVYAPAILSNYVLSGITEGSSLGSILIHQLELGKGKRLSPKAQELAEAARQFYLENIQNLKLSEVAEYFGDDVVETAAALMTQYGDKTIAEVNGDDQKKLLAVTQTLADIRAERGWGDEFARIAQGGLEAHLKKGNDEESTPRRRRS